MSSWIVQAGAALTVLIVLVVGIIAGVRSKPSPVTESPISGIEKPIQNSKENDIFADSDNDGLKNWQEDLWKTGKNTADTDGDGTNDGAEVAQNRDPIKLPPDTITFSATTDLIKTPSKPVNTPQQGQNNPNLQSVNPLQLPPQIEEIPVFITNNPLYDYGNTLARILTEGRDANRGLEQNVFNNLLTKDGEPTAADFDNLLKIAEYYKSLSQNISGISAPKEAVSVNSKLSLAYKSYFPEVEKLASHKNSLKIPVSAFATYNPAAHSVGEALYDTALFFKKQGIKFKSTDPGYIFTLPEK
jgi:hypothetical protein